MFERLTERPVERVHGPIAFAHRVVHVLAHADFERGHGDRAVVGALLDDDPEAFQLEEAAVLPEDSFHEQLERSVRGLELVAFVFPVLHLCQDLRHSLMIIRQVSLGRLGQYGGPAGQLRHQDSSLVAQQRGIDVLVRGGVFLHGIDVEPAFVRERVGAHKGLALAPVHIGQLVHVSRQLRQPVEPFPVETCIAGLQHEVGYHRAEVRVAAPFAQAVDRALHVRHAMLDCYERVARSEVAVVVSVDAKPSGRHLPGRVDRGRDFAGQRPSVGVAEHEHVRACVLRRGQCLERVRRVGLEAVEEVLRVEDHFTAVLLHVSHGVPDHPQILVRRSLQDLGHVQHPGLGHDRDRLGLDVEQRLQPLIGFGSALRLERAAERAESCVLEVKRPRLSEELPLLLVRQREAALDVVEAKLIELDRDGQLILSRERDPGSLAPVPERGVVDFDASRHGRVCGNMVIRRFANSASVIFDLRFWIENQQSAIENRKWTRLTTPCRAQTRCAPRGEPSRPRLHR